MATRYGEEDIVSQTQLSDTQGYSNLPKNEGQYCNTRNRT